MKILNLFSKSYYAIFGPTMAIIIMAIRPMIFLWFSYDFLEPPLAYQLAPLFPITFFGDAWGTLGCQVSPTPIQYEISAGAGGERTNRAQKRGLLGPKIRHFFMRCWVFFLVCLMFYFLWGFIYSKMANWFYGVLIIPKWLIIQNRVREWESVVLRGYHNV